ncbi:alpha/beta fold hydrolase [Altererythrobacter sp. ZODW24]|uniref:alpha/beta hydrolase n=1 Tax=Altererythrobacter sp. ZODW24 TaxID=2185142 RepID=UPI0019650031|nr:alpha/beta fold hydrolase [Altererythrobacter sp. ZODW24]
MTRCCAVALGISLVAACSTTPAPQSAVTKTRGDVELSPFYKSDSTLPERAGILIRQEQLEQRQSLVNAGSNIRILYSSTDGLSGDSLLPVSGVLYMPKGEASEGGWPLIAWTHGTVGIADICAPSWNGRQSRDENYLNLWLSRGYAVVASDYQGLGTQGTHPYLATRPAAYSNLDIIRAVQAGDFPLAKRVVLLGQSQGAGAAIATADYAKSYAPEIDLVGVVATGAPYFTPAVLDVLDRLRKPDELDPLLGYTFLGMTLVEQVDPDFQMRDYISDAAWPVASRVDDTCYAGLKEMVIKSGLTRRQSFARPAAPAMRLGFERMGYPSLAFDTPLFLGTGADDKDTPARMQAGLVMAACKAGTPVESVLYSGLNHTEVVMTSTQQSIPFVEAAFRGDEIKGNCDNLPFSRKQ